MQDIIYAKRFQVLPYFIDEKVKIKDLANITVTISEYGYTSDRLTCRTHS